MSAWTEPLVRLQGVSRHFWRGHEQVAALRDVDLDVETGELLVLAGCSGAGKTTLLGLLGGLDQPDAGRVVVAGSDLSRLSAHELEDYRLRTVGFVFQASGLVPLMTALENVALLPALCGLAPDAAREKAREALASVGLEARAEHRAYELSGGEQQRVALARALVKRPRLLLADEPTGQLDSETGAAIMRLLRGLAWTTVVLATHDVTLGTVADRMLTLEDGTLSAEG